MIPISIASHMLSACLLLLLGQSEHPPAASGEGKLLQLAAGIERGVLAGDADVVDSLVDLESIITNMTTGVRARRASRERFVAGFRTSFHLGKQICDAIAKDGSYKFLRLHEVDGVPHLLFRLLAGNGLNYHELRLATSNAGPPRIVDCYVFIAGEWLSETLRRVYIRAMAETDQSLGDTLLGKEQVLLRHVGDIKALNEKTQAGEGDAALAIYQKLPETLRADKTVQLLRLQATRVAADGDEYATAIADFARLFPDDPALDLVSIDGWFLKKEWDRTLQVIDHLDQRIGGDAYLDVMRGICFAASNRPDRAKECFAHAIEKEPTLAISYFQLIVVALREHDWKEVIRLLTALEKDLKRTLGDLESIDVYAEFVKSEDYLAWRQARTGK